VPVLPRSPDRETETSTSVLGAVALAAAALVALLGGISAAPEAPAPVVARVGTFDRARLVASCRRLGASEAVLAELERPGAGLAAAVAADVAGDARLAAIAEVDASTAAPWCAAGVELVDVSEALAARLAGGARR
jgi:hypothetical protein